MHGSDIDGKERESRLGIRGSYRDGSPVNATESQVSSRAE
jgi:hypothetical protein